MSPDSSRESPIHSLLKYTSVYSACEDVSCEYYSSTFVCGRTETRRHRLHGARDTNRARVSNARCKLVRGKEIRRSSTVCAQPPPLFHSANVETCWCEQRAIGNEMATISNAKSSQRLRRRKRAAGLLSSELACTPAKLCARYRADSAIALIHPSEPVNAV